MDDVLQEVSTSGKTVLEVLIDFAIVTEAEFYQVLADSLGTELYDLRQIEPPPEVLRLIPAGLARLHGALPIAASSDTITVCLVERHSYGEA